LQNDLILNGIVLIVLQCKILSFIEVKIGSQKYFIQEYSGFWEPKLLIWYFVGSELINQKRKGNGIWVDLCILSDGAHKNRTTVIRS